MDLRGKRVLVTGASSGIGAATARRAAARGAHAILVARSGDALEAVARDVRAAGGSAEVHVADLADPAAVGAMAEGVRRDGGAPDVLVNNAGAGRWLHAHETAPEEAAGMMAVPYLAAFAVTRAFLPDLLERRSGVVVNVTSAAAYMAWPGAAAYIAARWAVRGFTEALRPELRPHGVRVVLVAFAKVASAYWAHNPGSEERLPERQALIPVLSSEEAARHVVAGIEGGKERVMEPWQLRAVVALARLFPGIVK